MTSLGLKDVPIAKSDEEALGLTNYANVLREFIASCDTPITVALQGDWGSGKTSLMNLIKESLDQDKEQRYRTVWFNTWQYAQFNSSDTLALSMMSYFIDSLAPSGGSAARAAKSLLNVARALAVGGASVIGQADTVKTVITEAQQGTEGVDPSRALTQLKTRITKIVEETVGMHQDDRVVVFIDDIDRLVPVKAIELLEALKVFLDIDRCVYVIACDYSVVVPGLKEKFGVDEGVLQGKSFFDKIIQVPFKMPIRRYKVEAYVNSLLKKIGVEADDEDIEIYQDLIESSIGFNPRTMKRMFNSLVLLMILARKELRTAGDDTSRSKVLFGVLCMQEHYEQLYDFIRRERLSDRLFHSLIDEFDRSDELGQLRQRMSVGKAVDPSRVKSFIKAFFRCLQLDDDGDDDRLSSSELKHLRDILGLSSIVSASVDEFKVDADEFVLGLRRKLNERYDEYLNNARRRIGKFRYSRSEDEVFLELPRPRWCRFTVQIEEEYWGFGLEAERGDGSLSKVERHFREELASVDEVELRRDRYLAWYWRPADSASAKEDLERSLHAVLEEMLPRLHDLCKPFRG